MKNGENFQLLYDLADKMGAAGAHLYMYVYVYVHVAELRQQLCTYCCSSYMYN